MGDIVPFLAKVRSSGDWTPSERARLEELAHRLAAEADGVEVVFGATDEGDPWCVVKDAQDEVLVHVARIGGRFVIHFAFDDTLEEGCDLPSLLAERLDWEEEEREAVVVPFSRQAQSLLVLIIATAFYFETQHLEREEPGTAAPQPHDPGLPPDLQPLAADEAGLAHLHAAKTALLAGGAAIAGPGRSFAAAEDAAPWPGHVGGWSPEGGGGSTVELPAYASSASAHAAPEPTQPLRLAAAEGAIITTPALLPHGPEPLRAAEEPAAPQFGFMRAMSTGARQSLIEGTDQGDVIIMGPRVVAAGGAGADRFVLDWPSQMGDPGTRLGIIADFHPEQGDLLVTALGEKPAVLTSSQTTVVLTTLPAVLRTADGASPGMLVSGRHLEVDLDGDGKADGYVVLLDPPPPASHAAASPLGAPMEVTLEAPAEVPVHSHSSPLLDEEPVVLTGHKLEDYPL